MFSKRKETTHGNVVTLNDGLKKLLKMLHFENIPDEAKYLFVSDEKPEMCFMEDFKPGLVVPRIQFVSFMTYEGLEVKLDF